MDRRLIWTERASSDIEAIVRYIARRDPKASGSIGLGIYQRAQILLKHPEAGTVLDELREGRWRKLIYRRWKIVYQILDDVIVVGRVWPAAKGDADLSTPLE
ncbi:MAG: type II toxin-antitoxin system RelE/ParE family toxin [Verrucomicrobia bacterium]|nr:type II toxin-antitoxin system RelE/ParE family toxin [Verrucomicrobiota bacterium]